MTGLGYSGWVPSEADRERLGAELAGQFSEWASRWALAAFRDVEEQCADLAKAPLRGAYEMGAGAERDRWRSALAEHYLFGITCDHETSRDNPVCGCSRVHLGWHQSVGEARQAWVDHVTEVVTREGS